MDSLALKTLCWLYINSFQIYLKTVFSRSPIFPFPLFTNACFHATIKEAEERQSTGCFSLLRFEGEKGNQEWLFFY